MPSIGHIGHKGSCVADVGADVVYVDLQLPWCQRQDSEGMLMLLGICWTLYNSEKILYFLVHCIYWRVIVSSYF